MGEMGNEEDESEEDEDDQDYLMAQTEVAKDVRNVSRDVQETEVRITLVNATDLIARAKKYRRHRENMRVILSIDQQPVDKGEKTDKAAVPFSVYPREVDFYNLQTGAVLLDVVLNPKACLDSSVCEAVVLCSTIDGKVLTSWELQARIGPFVEVKESNHKLPWCGVGTERELVFEVKNLLDQHVEADVTLEGSASFSLEETTLELGPLQAVLLPVSFRPIKEGYFEATVRVRDLTLTTPLSLFTQPPRPKKSHLRATSNQSIYLSTYPPTLADQYEALGTCGVPGVGRGRRAPNLRRVGRPGRGRGHARGQGQCGAEL